MGKMVAPSWENTDKGNPMALLAGLYANMQSDPGFSMEVIEASDDHLIVQTKMGMLNNLLPNIKQMMGTTRQEITEFYAGLSAEIAKYLELSSKVKMIEDGMEITISKS